MAMEPKGPNDNPIDGQSSNQDLLELEKLASVLKLEANSPEAREAMRMLNIPSKDDLTVCSSGGDSEGRLRYSSSESMTVLEGIRIRATPTLLSSEASTTEPNTGHLCNLTPVQREKLFQLWGMLLSLFAQSYDAALSKKRREYATALLKTTQQAAHELNDITFTEAESTAFEANPLTDEFFYQCSTDDPDRTLLRFLRARKWVVVDAFNMLVDSLKWRHTVGLRKLMVDGERCLKPSLLEGGKNFFWKTDKHGRLMCYIRSRLHDKNAQTLQESINFTIYTVEWGRRLREDDEQLVSILFDMRDAPLSSLDIAILQFMVHALQSFYPEILGQCLVKDAPWIFNGFWKLVRPLLDPIVAKKISFVKQDELPNYIDKKNIPAEYGGDDGFVYRYIHPSPSDYPRSLDEDQSQLILTRIEVLKARLVEATREIYVLITRVEEPMSLEQLLVPVKERRDEIKKQLCTCYRELDRMVLPHSYYHRIGILDDQNKPDWSRYSLPGVPEVRMSAPPILSPHVQFELNE